MTRYAISQDKPLSTIYTEAEDVLDAVNWARRVLIDHAKHGELQVAKLPDVPYDEGDAQSELRYEETDTDRETERREAARMGLGGAESDSEELELTAAFALFVVLCALIAARSALRG